MYAYMMVSDDLYILANMNFLIPIF